MCIYKISNIRLGSNRVRAGSTQEFQIFDWAKLIKETPSDEGSQVSCKVLQNVSYTFQESLFLMSVMCFFCKCKYLHRRTHYNRDSGAQSRAQKKAKTFNAHGGRRLLADCSLRWLLSLKTNAHTASSEQISISTTTCQWAVSARAHTFEHLCTGCAGYS
jgi:hypothetical protein